jgi:phosphate transport system permease protein
MIPLQEVRRITLPNQMSDFSSFLYFIQSVWEFVSYQPKQNTTHTQVFPALFGTVLMVLLMTVLVLPMGVITAVFLNEYAGDGGFSQLVRAFVYNLASIPSIIYGVFGLVFLVYELGGGLDKLFYANSLPAPTFGTPGLFWASLTMALLTLPVVIIATEEGLKKVPVELRLASHALGATRVETIFRIVIPIASPSIVTGAILAIARGAGEVAPLILVGAVKLAPDLPVSFEFPFIHFEKQFMHLGVLLYDGSFQHSNPYQAETFMFAVCMLLLLLIFGLHLLAARLRGKLYNKYGYGVW